MENPVLIRCEGCAQAGCQIVCGEEAIVNVAGDILVDRVKCAPCKGSGGEVPSCVAACGKSAKKTLWGGSLNEKRVKASVVNPRNRFASGV
jgi:Fe-S-cluster-containing hydrogenase component 2